MNARQAKARTHDSRGSATGQGGDGDSNAESQVTLGWSPQARLVASVLLAFHVTAICLAPAANPPPTSDLCRAAAGTCDWYLQALYLNHGYRFFAPDPGPSHVVRYEFTLPDGGRGEGRFPNLEKHWPRLLYHRHLMISESTFNLCRGLRLPPPPVPPPRDTEPSAESERLARRYGFEYAQYQEALAEHRRVRPIAEALLTGIARDLLRRHGAASVALFVAEHDLPRMDEVVAGRRLDEPLLYEEARVGELSAQGEWSWDDAFREPRYELLP